MDLRRLLALPVVVALVAPALVGTTGCGAADEDEDEVTGRARRSGRVADASERLAQAGAWKLPAAVKAAGDQQHVGYDSPPSWSGGKNCTGTFTKGAAKLKAHLLSKYDGISSIGGYACRQNTANKSETSVHGTGRALDIMIPTIKGKADNTVGDEIANWLVVNAEDIGVQFIIWDQTKWNASSSGSKAKPYGGPVPHTDHIHVELDKDGAAMKTAWFKGSNDSAPDSDQNQDIAPNDAGNADNADLAGDPANGDAVAQHDEDAADEPVDAGNGAGCGDVTEAGACDGTTLKFCENGELVSAPCANGTTCGDDFPGSGYKVCQQGNAAGNDAAPAGDQPAANDAAPADAGNNPDDAFGVADVPADAGNADAGNADAGNAGGCGFVTEVGQCSSGQLSYCENGAVKQVDCKAQGRGCGFDLFNLYFDCL